MRTSLPYIARLEQPPQPDPASTSIESQVRAGLPHTFPLVAGWDATLVVPTGLARHWIDAPPDQLIASDDAQRSPAASGDPAPLVSPRLRLKRGGAIEAVLPLVCGWPFLVLAGGGRRLSLTVERFALHAGDMGSPGNFGSLIRITVADVSNAVDTFGPAPPSETVMKMLPHISRIESWRGFAVLARYRRLKMLKERKR